MTTIVYDHKARQIAVDSRTTSGGLINSECFIKWIQDGDDFWFISGPNADRERLIQHIKAVDPDKPKWDIECTAFLVSAGAVYQCFVTSDGDPCKSRLTYSEAIGSGAAFALAALDHGNSARYAVAYASTRDTGTGGKIRVFDIKIMQFINTEVNK